MMHNEMLSERDVWQIGTSFRGDLKRMARLVCAEHYELDPKFFNNDPNVSVVDGCDPRVAKRARDLLGSGMKFLTGPRDKNVS